MGLKLIDIGGDSRLQEEGIWLPFDEERGAHVLIASGRSEIYQTKLGKLMMKARRRNRSKNFEDPEVFRPVMFRAMFGTVVRAWKGFLGDDDKPEEFTEANVVKWLTNSKKFRDFVNEESMDQDNFEEGGENSSGGAEPPKEAAKSGAPVGR
jgi:hypothetical protein